MIAILLSASAVLRVVDLRLAINGAPLQERPFIDHTHLWPPQLSWTIESAELDLRQTAWTVRVDGVPVGDRKGGAMRHILPAPTRPCAAHTVDLSVTLADGRRIDSSGQFRTALLHGGFGNASWIGGGTLLQRRLSDLAVPPSPMATVLNATAFASGVGCFAIRLDGKLVSSSFMDPGDTHSQT